MIESTPAMSTPRPHRSSPFRASAAPASGATLPVRDVLLVAGLALVLRLVQLGHTPHYDELFHVLGGQSLLRDGDLCLADCVHPYTRGALFTYLVALSFKAFGVGLAAARVPSVVAGVLCVVVLQLLVGRQAGRAAGLAAGVLLAIDPGAIALSQTSRFYALQGALIIAAAALLYGFWNERRPMHRIGSLAAAGACFLLALYFQVTTLIAVLGIGLGLLAASAPEALAALHRRPAIRWGVASVASLGVLAFGAAVVTGVAAHLWRVYRWTPLFAEHNAEKLQYYHNWFLDQYDWLWILFPFAMVLALRRAPRLAAFALATFATGFAAHSLGGMKEFRVIYWAVPFFLIPWAIVLAELLPAFARRLRGMLAGIRPFAARPPAARLAATLFTAAAVAFAAVASPAYNTTLKMLTTSDADWPETRPAYRGWADWERARPALQAAAAHASIVVSSANPKSLFYLGRTEAALSANQLYDGQGHLSPQFAIDWRTGIPTVSSPSSVRRLVECYPSGLVVVDKGHWRKRFAVPDSTADVLQRLTSPVALPDGTGLVAVTWSHAPSPAAVCTPPPLAAADHHVLAP